MNILDRALSNANSSLGIHRSNVYLGVGRNISKNLSADWTQNCNELQRIHLANQDGEYINYFYLKSLLENIEKELASDSRANSVIDGNALMHIRSYLTLYNRVQAKMTHETFLILHLTNLFNVEHKVKEEFYSNKKPYSNRDNLASLEYAIDEFIDKDSTIKAPYDAIDYFYEDICVKNPSDLTEAIRSRIENVYNELDTYRMINNEL